MILTQLTKNKEDGGLETTWKLTEEQVGVLINVAVQMLISQGLAKIVEEFVDKDGNPLQGDLLATLNKEDLPRA